MSPAAAPEALAVDVAIVGGGMVGASLAAGLAGAGARLLLIEAVPFGAGAQPSFDERTTALGNASRRIFEGLGVWEPIAAEAAAIRAIHVSEAGRFGGAHLSAAEQGIEAFGYVVPNRRIGAALWGRLQDAAGLTLRVPGQVEDVAIDETGVHFSVVSEGRREPVSAALVVAADGAHSQVRNAAGIDAAVEDYGQVAVVANVSCDTPHEGTAHERFTPAGPIALLPLADGTRAVIWACRREDAHTVLALDDASWLRELQARFGWRAGRFTRAGRRGSYPLRLTRAAAPVANRTVLIGNAAQALHPVAGQGFNLGLRDAAMLAEVIANASGDVGERALLERFAAWRAHDRRGVVRFTDGLVRLFADERPGVGLVRNLGLVLFDASPPAKRALARVSLGFGGPTPRLARGLPVRAHARERHA
ncbi:MAG TPA: 2-octaprenyl-6-methoxyphenyl hydroxylase [Steroidobacteraceae bacterium]|nr:2-octaprenyl-6-methoxyphenyl hydroxylase [Steroidobacteraceae bacterium]